MVAGLPKGYALKMLKKWSTNCDQMVVDRPVTIFIAFFFEFFYKSKTQSGGGGRRPPSLFVESSKENTMKMVRGLPATIFTQFFDNVF